MSKEYESLSSLGNRLYNISVELHYGNKSELSNELALMASYLWKENSMNNLNRKLGYESGYKDGLKRADSEFIHISKLGVMTINDLASLIMVQE